MKTLLTLATLALLSTGAFAGKEHCVTRVLNTNYNSGMEGMASTACTATDSKFAGNEVKCETRK